MIERFNLFFFNLILSYNKDKVDDLQFVVVIVVV